MDFSVAVIIPNYNKESYIGQCIDSILKQTRLPNEIIIVDDCSTDSSVDIIKSYAKRYNIIKAVFLNCNGGVSNARNKGLEVAASEYVTFTDSDDFYYSERKLENEMNLIQKNMKEGRDVVAYSAIVRVDEQGNLIKLPDLCPKNFMQENILFDLLMRSKKKNVPRDYCVKRNVLCSVGGYSFYKDFYEDLDLLMRLSLKIPFVSTCEYGMAYRMMAGGLSKRDPKQHRDTVDEIIRMYSKQLPFLKKMFVVMNRRIQNSKKFLFERVKNVLYIR